MSNFVNWDVDEDCIEFIFPPRYSKGRLTFTEFLWVETLTKIRNLPEASGSNF